MGTRAGGTPPATEHERAQLDQALAILEKEESRGPLSPLRSRCFLPLVWYAYSVAAAASLLALGMGSHELLEHWREPRQCSLAIVHAVLRVFVGTTLILAPVNIAASVFLHSAAVPLFAGVWRWSRGMRAAGLAESLGAPWREERAKHRARNAITLLMGPWILVWGLVFALVHRAFPEQAQLGDAPLLGFVHVSDLTVYACTLLTVPLGFHYLLLHYLLREMERVRVVRALIRALRGAEESGASTILLTPAFRQAARIERAQIARERLLTIRRFEQRGVSSYLVRKSQDFRQALARLAHPVQLRVQDLILALSSTPHMAGVRRVEDGDQRWIDVPATELELGFAVDDARHALVALALRSRAPSSAGAGPREAR